MMKRAFTTTLLIVLALPCVAYAQDDADAPEPLTAEQVGQEAARKALDYLESTETFVAREAPLFIRELIAWGFWSHAVLAVAFAVLFAVSLLVTGWFVRQWRTFESQHAFHEPVLEVFGSLGAAIASVVFLGLVIGNAYFALHVWIAPRVYVVEELGRMVGS